MTKHKDDEDTVPPPRIGMVVDMTDANLIAGIFPGILDVVL